MGGAIFLGGNYAHGQLSGRQSSRGQLSGSNYLGGNFVQEQLSQNPHLLTSYSSVVWKMSPSISALFITLQKETRFLFENEREYYASIILHSS